MHHFQTSIDSLTITAIKPSCSIDKDTISGYCDAIVAGADSCNAYYHARSNNGTYSAHNEAYTSFAVTLEDMFTKAMTFDSCSQLALVQTLQQTLCQHGNKDNFAEAFMKRYDATLQEILTQLLETRNAPLESSKHMKQVAFELLSVILGVCRPFESSSWVTERLYNLDWSESLNEQASVNSAIIFVSTIESYGKSVLENLDPTLVEEYTASLITPCVRAASSVGNILKKISPKDEHGDLLHTTTTALAITNTILDLISFCHDVPLKSSGNTTPPHSFSTELLVLVFDKVVLNTDLGLSHAYCELFHSTYTVNNPGRAKVGSSAHNALSGIMDCIYRCLALTKQNGVTFDNLLALKQRQHDQGAIHRSPDSLSRGLTISNDGIMSILALSIYERYLNDSSANGHYLLSVLIEPAWIGRRCLGMIMNLLKNPQEIPKIDKAMLVLLFLADNVDDINFKVTLDMLDQEFEGLMDGGDQKMTLAKAFQIMTSITSMVDDPKLRFLGHQLIARFIQLGNDDTRLFILTELLGNCPFPTMHTAAIGLLKDQVDHAFRLLPHTSPNDRSVFCTKILLDNFFPMIFKNRIDKATTEDEYTSFWDKYSYHMQALNFYYYLMMRDKSENNTGVWDEDQMKWMRDTYLVPLEELCAALYGTYQQKQVHRESTADSTSENDDQYSKMMQLDLVNDVIRRIAAMTRHG